MNIIKSVISFIKKIFTKQEKVKTLDNSNYVSNQGKKDDFINSLNIPPKEKNIETPLCEGDGLGIQRKISY